MALVNISDAAKLVRKARTTVLRDIENGGLTKTVLQDGDVRIDTAELLRFYGRLHSPQATPKPRETRKESTDKTKIALLEERIRSLERVITLEAELRRVKDQVTSELRLRLADKDHIIKILESKILFLEYDLQTLQSRSVPTLEPEQAAPSQPKKPGGTTTATTATTAAAKPAPAAPTATPVTASPSATMQAASFGTGKPAAPAASSDAAKAANHAGTTPKPSAPTGAPQQQTTATKPAATTIHTYTTPARAVPGAPGGVERRRSSKEGGWWRRLFGGKPRNH